VSYVLHSIAQAKREHCGGDPVEDPWGAQLSSGEVRHHVGEREEGLAKAVSRWLVIPGGAGRRPPSRTLLLHSRGVCERALDARKGVSSWGIQPQTL
jgi:hypothetical protein